MAENEFLDLARSRRWQRVYRGVVEGRPSDQIAPLVAICLRQTINSIRKPSFAEGSPQVPLGDLLEAWEHGPEAVEQMVRKKCRGHDYARLFGEATLDTATPKEALVGFTSAICEKFFDQIAVRGAKGDGGNTFAQVRSKLNQIREYLTPEICEIAHQLSTDPGKQLRRPRPARTDAKAISLDTPSILNESLLGLQQ
jgi:hypothetical protein